MNPTTTTPSPTTDEILALMHFMPRSQWACLLAGLQGEERRHVADLLKVYARRVATMPKTYETDGQGGAAIAHLHYFSGGGDWYITEKGTEPVSGDGEIGAPSPPLPCRNSSIAPPKNSGQVQRPASPPPATGRGGRQR